MAKETTPKAPKKATTKKEGEQNIEASTTNDVKKSEPVNDAKESIKKESEQKQVETFKVFDKKSNRPRMLTQEEIDLDPTRYQLR